MALLKKKALPDGSGVKELQAELEAARGRATVCLDALRALVTLMLDFLLDIRELDPDRFRRGMNRFCDELAAEERERALSAAVSRQQKAIRAYARRQGDHVAAREKELKGIIEFLTRAMAAFGDDNRDFADSLNAHGEEIEKISGLDDIRQLKRALQDEIGRFREVVSRKQDRDRQRFAALTEKVGTLNLALEEAKAESLTDGLTRVANRKAFDRLVCRLVSGNTVRPVPFSLLLLDVDDFKVINDTYGHQTGDRILMALAAKCRQLIRGEDFCARYGGEEFAVVLPGARLKNGLKRARKICRAVDAARYRVDFGEDEVQIGFTVSIGVAAWRKGDTVATLLRRADEALYQAKSSGKNTAVSETAPPR